MIQELINKIADAEAQADRMIAAALEEARAMNINAQSEAANIIISAKEKIKQEKRLVTESAEKLAEERYKEILYIGESEAAKLVSKIKIKEESKAVADAYIMLYKG